METNAITLDLYIKDLDAAIADKNADYLQEALGIRDNYTVMILKREDKPEMGLDDLYLKIRTDYENRKLPLTSSLTLLYDDDLAQLGTPLKVTGFHRDDGFTKLGFQRLYDEQGVTTLFGVLFHPYQDRGRDVPYSERMLALAGAVSEFGKYLLAESITSEFQALTYIESQPKPPLWIGKPTE